MAEETPNEPETGTGRPRREPAVALGRAIWSEQVRTDAALGTSKKARDEDWSARRKAFTSQGRRILRRLEKEGYSLSIVEKP